MTYAPGGGDASVDFSLLPPFSAAAARDAGETTAIALCGDSDRVAFGDASGCCSVRSVDDAGRGAHACTLQAGTGPAIYDIKFDPTLPHNVLLARRVTYRGGLAVPIFRLSCIFSPLLSPAASCAARKLVSPALPCHLTLPRSSCLASLSSSTPPPPLQRRQRPHLGCARCSNCLGWCDITSPPDLAAAAAAEATHAAARRRSRAPPRLLCLGAAMLAAVSAFACAAEWCASEELHEEVA